MKIRDSNRPIDKVYQPVYDQLRTCDHKYPPYSLKLSPYYYTSRQVSYLF